MIYASRLGGNSKINTLTFPTVPGWREGVRYGWPRELNGCRETGRACGCCCSGHRKSVAGPGLAVARPPSMPEGAPVSPGVAWVIPLPAGVPFPRTGCVPFGVCPVEGDSLSSRRLKPAGCHVVVIIIWFM